jgi:Zn-dependent protease with chaperone function
MSYTIVYYDGTSSKMHKALLQITALKWEITYTEDNDNSKIISWNPAIIKRTNVHTENFISFSYGESFPFQRIEGTDTALIEHINTTKNNDFDKLNVLLHTNKKSSFISLLITILGIAIAMYFYVIPAVTTSFISNLNHKSVEGFGNFIFKVLSTDLEIDDEKTKKLQNFVNAIQIESTFPLKVYVAKNEDINAFALSGGKIVVYTALLEKIKNESQLLALISHEISHIENRHVLKNVTRNLSGAIFISVLFGDISGINTVLAENAHLFSQLSFTRSLEKEADIYGLKIMKDNQVDLYGMSELFAILKKETTFSMPTYLSNHPMLEDRIEYTKKIAQKQNIVPENILLKEKWDALKTTFTNIEITDE